MPSLTRPAALLAAAILLVAGLATPATAAHPSSPWPTYHGNGGRTGDAGASTPALTGALRVGWRADLGGAVYAEPIVVGSTAIIATEHNAIGAVSLSTGKTMWVDHLGTAVARSQLPCGNIDPLGITGTPAYDPASGSLFVVSETTGAVHTLWSLSAATGAVRWKRNLDVTTRDRHAEQERAAVLVTSSRVIVAFGGLNGDCGNYIGYLTSVATNGGGGTLTYAVPSAREAGAWAPPGPVVAPNGQVLVSVGNGAATGGRWDGSDSVLAIDPRNMRRTAAFSPTSWPSDNAQDLDLGSSSPVLVGSNVMATGKRGTSYLLGPHLGGAGLVGGQLASATTCKAFGGAAVRGSTVYLPCTTGLQQLTAGTHSISRGWHAAGIPGSPVLAGNVAYLVDPTGGKFYELSLSSGAVRASVALGAQSTRFGTPTVVNGGGAVLVPTYNGVLQVV